MSVLPDVNLLLAYGWQQNPFHAQCSSWLEGLVDFALCPITELGFLRVSMSPAFRASFDGASQILQTLRSLPGARQIPCDIAVSLMPQVGSYKDTTDAYLESLAKQHSYRFATLDEGILTKTWASGIAYNPMAS